MTPTTLSRAYDAAANGWGATVARLGYPGAYRALLAAFPPAGRNRVLDAGCGSGAFALAWCEIAGEPGRLTLLDPSRPMLDAARAALPAPAKTLIQAGLGTGKIAPGSQDAVLCAHVVEHLPEPGAALGWLLSRLRPGGRLYLVASRPHWCTALLRWKWGHRAYRPGHMLEMLSGAGAANSRAFVFPVGPPSRTSMGYVADRS